MNELHVSVNAVVAVCLRMTKECFPNVDISCNAQDGENGMAISIAVRGKESVEQLVFLRKRIFENVLSYTGIRVASVLTKMEA